MPKTVNVFDACTVRPRVTKSACSVCFKRTSHTITYCTNVSCSLSVTAELCVFFLQSFLRDAEQLESLTASDEAFLDFDDLGVSYYVFFVKYNSLFFSLDISLVYLLYKFILYRVLLLTID